MNLQEYSFDFVKVANKIMNFCTAELDQNRTFKDGIGFTVNGYIYIAVQISILMELR